MPARRLGRGGAIRVVHVRCSFGRRVLAGGKATRIELVGVVFLTRNCYWLLVLFLHMLGEKEGIRGDEFVAKSPFHTVLRVVFLHSESLLPFCCSCPACQERKEEEIAAELLCCSLCFALRVLDLQIVVVFWLPCGAVHLVCPPRVRRNSSKE